MKKRLYAWPDGQKAVFRVDDGYVHDAATDHIVYYIAQDGTIREFPGGEVRFWIVGDFVYDKAEGGMLKYFFAD